MADPLIWSKLPEHLVPYIIEQAQDLKTLKNWCDATKGTGHLHQVATRLRWKTFTIHKRNLHLDDHPVCPDKDYFTAKRIGDTIFKSELGQAIFGTHGGSGYGVIPATLIKRLLVNFQTRWGIDSLKDVVAHLGVLAALDILLNRNPSLEEVAHFGLLRQAQLDRFVKIPTLSKIKLRKTNGCTGGFYENVQRMSFEVYLEAKGTNLAKLSYLSKLTLLEVAQLHSLEASGLAKAVRSLTQLQDLRISEMLGGSRPFPLALFLRKLYSESSPSSSTNVAFDTSSDLSDSGDDLDYLEIVKGTEPGFPASLRSLKLVDNTKDTLDEDSLEAEWGFLRKGAQQPLSHLTSLYLDIKYASVIVDILQKIAPPHLNHLAVSKFTKHAVYDKLPRLQHLVLLNAWEHSDFSTCNPFSYPRQVYLAEPPPKIRNELEQSDYVQSILDRQLSTRIFSYNSQPTRWGAEVRHLRVDQIDPETLRVDRIDSEGQGLKKLRVMVLRPTRVVAEGPWIWNLETEAYPKELFGPPLPDPEAMSQLPEYIFASQLAAQDLPELRLIAVGKYRFLVQRPRKKPKTKSKNKPAEEKPESKLWFLRRALEDPTEEKKILEWATKRDWEFLGDKEARLTEKAAAQARRKKSRVVLFKEVEGWGE